MSKFKKTVIGVLIGALLGAAPLFGAPTTTLNQFLTASSIIENAGFENGKAAWTASAGSFTITSTAANVGKGLFGASFDAGAASQTLSSDAVAIPAGLYGRNGYAKILAKTAATDYKLQVTDGTNVLSEVTIPASSTFIAVSTNFIYPSSGNIVARIISASDAAAIYFDDVFLGDALNLTNVSQASFVGSSYFAATGTSVSRNSATIGSFTEAAGWPGPTIESQKIGQWQTTDTDLPKQTINNLPSGIYLVTFAAKYVMNASAVGSLAITDDGGTTLRGNISFSELTTQEDASTLVGWFEYETAGDRTFEIVGAATSGSLFLYGTAIGYPKQGFTIYRFPLDSQIAVTSETQNWFVDAQVKGAAINLGTSTVASWTEMTNSGLSLETFDRNTIPVGIACSSTNQSTVGNTTCSAGNESNGITFNVQKTGNVLVCVSFMHKNFTQDSTDILTTYFQVVETPSNAQTILQELKNFTGDHKQQYTGVDSTTWPHSSCGIAKFDSIGQKTLRLMYRQETTDTPNESLIDSRDTSNIGIHWTVIPLNQNFPMPNIVNSVETPTAGGERIVTGRFYAAAGCTSSPCAITNQNGGLTSFTRTGTGTYRANFATAFSGVPVCNVTAANGPAVPDDIYAHASEGDTTTTYFQFVTRRATTGSATDANFNVTCIGPK